MIETTLQRDETRILECAAVLSRSERCEFRHVYSSIHLCVTTSHDQFT